MKSNKLSLSEAIKILMKDLENQSWMLDTTVISKNFSKILKEHGFMLEDLNTVYFGVAARQELINSLKEN